MIWIFQVVHVIAYRKMMLTKMMLLKRKYEVVRNSSTLYFTKQRNQEERMKNPTQIEKLQTVKNQVEAIHLQKRQSLPPHQPPLKKTKLPHSRPQKSQVTLYGEGVEK